jgi:hypothetical protein
VALFFSLSSSINRRLALSKKGELFIASFVLIKYARQKNCLQSLGGKKDKKKCEVVDIGILFSPYFSLSVFV